MFNTTIFSAMKSHMYVCSKRFGCKMSAFLKVVQAVLVSRKLTVTNSGNRTNCFTLN